MNSIKVSPSRPNAAEPEPVAALVELHFDAVWRVLRRLGVPTSEADDAAQRVFMVAARRLSDMQEGRERAFLVGVATRVASETRRMMQRRREVALEDDDDDGGQATPELGLDEETEQRRDLARLGAIVKTLPDEMRQAFVLFDIEELSGPEVAEALGVPLGTVASRVRRAREQIREAMTKTTQPKSKEVGRG